MKETSGGHNVFGHDPAPACGWGIVTEVKYRAYERAYAKWRVGQGVGPMQLTFRGYQIRADYAGGCYKVGPNIEVGAAILADHFRRSTGTTDQRIWAALRAYNGSAAYADSVLKGVRYWREIL
jgi:hypothetical protein